MAIPPPPPAQPLPAPPPVPASLSAHLRASWLEAAAQGAETVPERVGVIEGLMREGTWHKSLSPELSRLWQVTQGAIRRYASEAKRRVLTATPSQARAHVEELLEHAEELIPNAPDPSGAAVKVAMAWAKLHGLDRPGAPQAGGQSSGTRELSPVETWWGDGNEGEANGEK